MIVIGAFDENLVLLGDENLVPDLDYFVTLRIRIFSTLVGRAIYHEDNDGIGVGNLYLHQK